MSEVTTVNLYWIWTVLSAVTVIGLGGLFLGVGALSRQRADRQALQARVSHLEQHLKVLSAGSIGVGRRLTGVSKELQTALERQSELENRDPGQLPYRQAAKLVSLGASVDELVDSCGLSRGEAELMNLLQGGGVRQRGNARAH